MSFSAPRQLKIVLFPPFATVLQASAWNDDNPDPNTSLSVP